MSIDINTLLGNTNGIQVAKADYDFARDGGALYNCPANSEIIPAGSIIIGYAIYTSTGLVFSTAGTLGFTVAGVLVATAPPTVGNIIAALYTGVAAFVTTAARSIEAYISGSTITAGAATIWLFYLPT